MPCPLLVTMTTAQPLPLENAQLVQRRKQQQHQYHHQYHHKRILYKDEGKINAIALIVHNLAAFECGAASHETGFTPNWFISYNL